MSDYFDDAEDAKLLAVEQADNLAYDRKPEATRPIPIAAGKELRDMLLLYQQDMLDCMWGGGHD